MTELNGANTANSTQAVQVNPSAAVEVEQPRNNQPLPRNRFNSFEDFQATVREMFISGSAIDPIMFDACVVFHQDQEYMDGGDVETPIHDLLNWESFKRFSHQTSEKLYAAFLMNEDNTPWQAVLSMWDEEKQRPYKYLAPTNNGDRAFLPPIPSSIRKKIGSRYGLEVPDKGSFWQWLQDTDIPRVITEGGKKSLCGLSQGYAVISLYGCHCGAKTKNEEGEKVDAYVIDDIEKLATEGSRWLTALDRDDKHKTKLSTTRGKKRILKALKNYGCIVGDIEWKNSDGKGLDDFMVNSGGGAFDAAYAKAIAKLEKQFESRGDESKNDKSQILKADIVAAEIAEDHRDKLIWNNEHKSWMVYEKDYHTGIWGAVDDHYVETLIQSILETKGVKGYGTDSYIQNIRKFLSRRLVVFKWEERQGILPFQDGLVDIATGNFEEHSPGNRLTWCLPRKYQIPLINDWGTIRTWMEEAWPDPSDREVLLCFAAAVIRNRYDLQKFLYMVGSGGSGKGTYTRLLEAVIGEPNVWAGQIESLSDKNDCARLIGKPLAVFADQDKVIGKLQTFKNLTGGDDLTGKRLYKDGFNFKYKGLALVTANASVLLGAGSWIKRRALLIKSNYQPPVERNLDEEFKPEIAAFTRYLLTIDNEQIDFVLKHKRPTSGGINLAMWENLQENSICAWIEECVLFDENAFTQTGRNQFEWRDKEYNPDFSTLFGSYCDYARKAGAGSKGLSKFVPELLEICQKVLGMKFVDKARGVTGIRGLKGIKLRRPTDPIFSDSLLTTFDKAFDKASNNPEPLLDKLFDNLDKINDEKSIQINIDFESISEQPATTLILNKEEQPADNLTSVCDEKSTPEGEQIDTNQDANLNKDVENACQACQKNPQDASITSIPSSDKAQETTLSETRPLTREEVAALTVGAVIWYYYQSTWVSCTVVEKPQTYNGQFVKMRVQRVDNQCGYWVYDWVVDSPSPVWSYPK